MFDPVFLDAAGLSIRVTRADGSVLVLEPSSDPDLFAQVKSGGLGPVAAFEPAIVLPAAAPDPVCSRLQAKAALLQSGLLDQVETLMVGMDPMTRLAWTEAIEFRRSSPLINSLAAFLTWPDGSPLTDADLDDLFTLARTIEV